MPVSSAATAGPASRATDKLPVKRVVLFKNGVGFFEHVGSVRGNQDVTIAFTSGQLDDVLKSLTTLDLGSGRITGISYNSEDTLARRLGALRLPLDESTSLVQFLTALRGAKLEIGAGGAPVVGRLLSVDERSVTESGNKTAQAWNATLVSDTGDVRTVTLTPAAHVRILEPDVTSQVNRYLGLVASTRDADVRRMVISTSGDGTRQLYVSYISEVPIWKTTYRLVLPDKAGEKAVLQGWAVVDNTIGEDWENVDLSLVAGAPQSFIQQISQPYYARRPVVPLPQAVLLQPQTHEGTLTTENKVSGVEGGITGGVAGGIVGGMPVVRAESGAPGAGGRTAARAPAAAPPPPPPPGSRVAMERVEEVAVGRDLGDLFEYKLKQPVTIRTNQSALVPIVSAQVGAEKVSLWNESSGARPLRAVWLTNSTSLTLDGGSFTVLDNETFTGEGLVSTIKPGENRLLSYAVDLGVLVDTKRDSEQQRVSSVRISHGIMTARSEERERRTYTIRNEDTQSRDVIIEHPIRAQWKLTGAAKPEESSSGFDRFRVPVKSKTTVTLTVEEVRPIDATYQVSEVTPEQIALLLRQQSINPTIEQALQRILSKKQDISDVGTQIDAKQSQIDTVFHDQERVRENMKALKGSASEKPLLERYTQQMMEQENQLAALRKDVTALDQRRRTLQDELGKMIEGLVIE